MSEARNLATKRKDEGEGEEPAKKKDGLIPRRSALASAAQRQPAESSEKPQPQSAAPTEDTRTSYDIGKEKGREIASAIKKGPGINMADVLALMTAHTENKAGLDAGAFGTAQATPEQVEAERAAAAAAAAAKNRESLLEKRNEDLMARIAQLEKMNAQSAAPPKKRKEDEDSPRGQGGPPVTSPHLNTRLRTGSPARQSSIMAPPGAQPPPNTVPDVAMSLANAAKAAGGQILNAARAAGKPK